MAATSVKMQQEFQAKLQEQERRFEELKKHLDVEISSYKQELQEQEKKFEEKHCAQKQEFHAKFQKQEREGLKNKNITLQR